ncbi:MAG: FAD-dependent oxidoreductase [Candidatus Marsarchaeota archaeon]|nr:FAD-dependent oxidoreductase [Candidatus Marsarchaeota archaeon]MCL5101775.1 FAD-dependent oxidoreductase [Candidatus Marsarchaeota archaeon]
MEDYYDLIIIGAGITGSALAYVASRYSDMKSILVLEKYGKVAPLNSDSTNNSQTLHFGDIETNYTLEEAAHTKASAERVLYYSKMLSVSERSKIISPVQKMVLGVGPEEVKRLEKIYSPEMRKLFPGLKKLGRKELQKIEPNTIKGRDPDEEVSALLSDKGYMVNFGLLAKSFHEKAKKAGVKTIFNCPCINVNPIEDGHEVVTPRGNFKGRFVIFAAGTYSLYFAKKLGYDKNLSIFSVGGGFYIAPRVLKGKVYRVQAGGIPFAAIHGDPDITNPKVTRFGPTVSFPLALEVRKGGTTLDYLKTFDFDIPTIQSLFNILFNKDILRIMRRNAVYPMPLFGKNLFIKNEVSKIVPSLTADKIYFDKSVGGIRPQIIDENKRFLSMGASKIRGNNIMFNITPSPGATSSLQSAMDDIVYISTLLDIKLDEERMERELGRFDYKHLKEKINGHKQI